MAIPDRGQRQTTPGLPQWASRALPPRILARAWLFVIWHCWQNNTGYLPAEHRALQRGLVE